jgi:N-acetylglucosamine-6-phosphate deacetylase
VSPVGAPPGSSEFELGGQRVRVQDGRCVNDAGVLAGSALDMASAVRNAARHLGVDLDEALRMAATYPAEAVGLGPRKGRIAPGYDADLVWFDDEVRVLGTLVGGELEPAGR